MDNRMSVQQVYEYLRRVLGSSVAYNLLESLEGDTEGYENLKSMILSGELETKK